MTKSIFVPCRPGFELGQIVATPGALAATTDKQRFETKREALERVGAPTSSGRLPSWKRDASVLAWLDTL